MRHTFFLWLPGLVALVLFAGEERARACGGCFHESQPPTQGPQTPDVVTDHRMIFRITQQQTTLYDEIEYQGSPASFAWVLPIHGPVTVGLSSDIVFAALDSLTATTILPPYLPPCQPPPGGGGDYGGGGGSYDPCSYGADASVGASYSGGDAGMASDAAPPPVEVIGQQTVGPYETVQLQSTDPNALESWLTANGYSIPPDVAPVIAAYVQEGFDFLAMKLAPGQGVSAMRPVRVTSPGAGLTLPLRMVAAGTGATVGITLWVLADGRYDPQNFSTFTISPSDLVWDWSTKESNYTTLRARNEVAYLNSAWQIESSDLVGAYAVENLVLAHPADQDYLPVPTASNGGPEGGATDAGPPDASTDGGGESADQARTDDLAILFPGGESETPRVTRLRADLTHWALAQDLILSAGSQDVISSDYQVTQSVNQPTCPYDLITCNNGSNGANGGGPFQGCSTSRDGGDGDAVPWLLGGLVGLTIFGRRSRRRLRA
jgi:hypothetical protein